MLSIPEHSDCQMVNTAIYFTMTMHVDLRELTCLLYTVYTNVCMPMMSVFSATIDHIFKQDWLSFYLAYKKLKNLL